MTKEEIINSIDTILKYNNIGLSTYEGAVHYGELTNHIPGVKYQSQICSQVMNELLENFPQRYSLIHPPYNEFSKYVRLNEPKIAIVNKNDDIIGFEEKMKVHKDDILHRAFSVFIFNDRNELLLQKRADNKYHSAGLWSNTCCSHLYENQNIKDAAKERLFVEMGIHCSLTFLKKFEYYATFENSLIENEIDYIFIGKSNENPNINKDEVSDFKWIDIEKLKQDIDLQPDLYSYWLIEIIKNQKKLSG